MKVRKIAEICVNDVIRVAVDGTVIDGGLRKFRYYMDTKEWKLAKTIIKTYRNDTCKMLAMLDALNGQLDEIVD